MMSKNKVWKIKGYEGSFTDEQIISLIKSNRINGDDSLCGKDMKIYIKIKDSIYEYYLKKDKKNETI